MPKFLVGDLVKHRLDNRRGMIVGIYTHVDAYDVKFTVDSQKYILKDSTYITPTLYTTLVIRGYELERV